MQVVKLPLVGPLYQNSDQIATPGNFSPVMYNGYLSEANSIRKIPGLASFADTGSGQNVNGIFWDYNNALLLAATNGKLYRYPNSAGTARIDVSGGITLASGGVVKFAYYEDANYGGVVFAADGGKLNFLSELPSIVSNSGNNFRCIKLHPGSTAASEPGVGGSTATYWQQSAAWSGTSVSYTVFYLVSNGGNLYRCDVAHTSGASTEPGVGASWEQYWTQVSAVAWSSAAYYRSGVLEEIADADAPTAVSFVTVMDGYVIALEDGTGRFWWSETGDWQTWGGEYATAESQSDLAVALDSAWNQITVLGTLSFERWENDGTTPFVVNKPASVPSGTIAKYSFCKFDNTWWWLDEKRQMVRLNGTLPEVVSLALAKILSGITNITDCIVSGVTVDGKPWLLIALPSEGRTWVFDVSLGVNGWCEVADWDSGNAEFVGWRVREWIYSPQWNLVLCAGDDGKIYKLDDETYTYGGDTIRFERRTGEVDHGTRAWKRSHEVVLKLKRTSRAQEDTDFTMLLSWRDNGSTTWSNDRTITLTKVGDTEYIAKETRLGRYRTRQYRLIISDPSTDWSLVDAEERVSVDRL